MAHLKSFPSKIKSISSDYQDLNIFIKDFENFISTELKVPSKDLSTQDKIFEGIINRLDFLNDYKNITLRIYLESQKKPKYFLNLSKNINNYFNLFLNSQAEKIISNIDLHAQIQWVIAIILSILVIATTTFWIWNKLKPSKLVNEMTLRTKSWWGMCFVFLFALYFCFKINNSSTNNLRSNTLSLSNF